jgi:hypothetical protein
VEREIITFRDCQAARRHAYNTSKQDFLGRTLAGQRPFNIDTTEEECALPRRA